MNKYFLYFFTIRFGKRVPPSSDVTTKQDRGWKTDENPKFCLKIKTPTWQSKPNDRGPFKGTKKQKRVNVNQSKIFHIEKQLEDFATGLTLHHKYS